jgi:hypothetical protein
LSLDRCPFLARAPRAGERERLRERIERLARWHGGRASWTWVGECGAAGVVRYDDREEDLGEPIVFGEAAADGSGATLTVESGRASLASGGGWPGVLFASSSGGFDAWSTHAVAAAWLAGGRARVDAGAIPEQLAAEFVGGARSLVEGARPLPSGVRVAIDDAGARVEEPPPLARRWAPVPEEEAAAHAERALMESLERRVPGGAYASLTAGLDSRVVAVALRELGLEARGFTWGEPDWDDVRGGAELAAALGMEHERVPIEWLPGDEAFDELHRQVRWNEGAIQVGFARLGWPAGMPGFVTGAGGEMGRAFYYRGGRPRGEEASQRELVAELARLLGPRLAGARPEALEALGRSLGDWVDEAAAAGLPGWRTLDVVYAEQRVRRWLRGMLPRLRAPMIPAFATPEIARALASMPLAERLADGFHRGFLERHAPELVPPVAAAPRRSRLRLPGRLRRPQASPLRARWDDHPGFRDWIAHGVLDSPLVTEPLGVRWAIRTRERFLAGDAHAESMALAAGGPVALAEALAELERGSA